MTETIQYARKVGGSLMVTIPKEVADLEGIHAGEMIKININKIKHDLCGAFPTLTSMKKEEKIDIKWSKFENHG
ncbi:MAG: AbrB/MazE/SpoVT family DNA-binding domain-containing protein [Candidatus Woesearchaeota archaeon]|jgi:antitoxin component of MazEF toxin-antitoxin module